MTDDDKELFRKAMKDVTPLHDKGKASHAPKRKKVQQRAKLQDTVQHHPISDQISEQVSAEQRLSFARSGFSKQRLLSLKRGDYPAEARLDLHKMTIDHARTALQEFLHQAKTDGLRSLLIIHGKGTHSRQAYPAIKNAVNSWLQQIPDVLAFTSATAQDGGTGALYVLLKRQRD